MAVKFDRSQFKAKKLTELAKQKAEIDSKSPKNQGRAGVMRLKNKGEVNHLRIAPAHPDKNWYEIVSTSFLPLPKKDKDGNLIEKDGKPVLGQRPVFTANFHGPDSMNGIDPISLYIDFIKNKAYGDDSMDKETAKKFLNPIYGWRSGKTYHGGINPSKKVMVYGWLDGVFGRIELSPSITDKMDVLAMGFDPAAGPVATDPWTDPDEGVGLLISFDDSQDNPSNKWQVSVSQKEVKTPIPLTDAQFNEFVGQTPLTDLYKNVFDSSTFDLQMTGLKNFEKLSGEKLKANGFDGQKYEVFSYDEFLDAVSEVALLVPSKEDKDMEDDKDDESENTNEPDVIESQSEEVEEIENEEEEMQWTVEMIDSLGKEDLKTINEDGDGLGLKFNSTHKVADMRMMVKIALGLEQPKPKEQSKSPAKSSSQSRMEALKAKMKANS